MKIATILLLVGSALFAMAGHGNGAPVPQSQPTPVRLTLDEATSAVRKEIFRLQPDMNPSAKFPLKELTTPEIWARLHAQVFVVTNGIVQYQAFLLHDGTVVPLGNSLGGFGLMSMCVADLAADGKPALVFTYSWGSGIHRSLVGIWAGGATWIDAKPALRDYDLLVEKTDDTHVRIAFGEFDAAHGAFARKGDFGTLRLSHQPAGAQLEIIPSDTIPKDIAARLWK